MKKFTFIILISLSFYCSPMVSDNDHKRSHEESSEEIDLKKRKINPTELTETKLKFSEFSKKFQGSFTSRNLNLFFQQVDDLLILNMTKDFFNDNQTNLGIILLDKLITKRTKACEEALIFFLELSLTKNKNDVNEEFINLLERCIHKVNAFYENNEKMNALIGQLYCEGKLLPQNLILANKYFIKKKSLIAGQQALLYLMFQLDVANNPKKNIVARIEALNLAYVCYQFLIKCTPAVRQIDIAIMENIRQQINSLIHQFQKLGDLLS